MKAIYNSRIMPAENIGLEIHNRAFCYGDGLFETIVTGNDRINLIDYHLLRLTRACDVLDMKMPFTVELLKEMMEQLRTINQLGGNIRYRLQLWRNPGGLYQPLDQEVSYLLTAADTDKPFYSAINSISTSKQAQVGWHALSFAKTMSAMPYILAGLERKQGDHDDLIICNHAGQMAETIASNIFWTKGEEVFTPSLESGCIAGVMRNYLIDELADTDHKVQEVLTSPEALLSADAVFLTNASGIQWVQCFEDKHYINPEKILSPLFKLPQQL